MILSSPIITLTLYSNDDQRHLTDSMIKKLRTIPKSYPVNLIYNADKETSIFVSEVKKKLIDMGYKLVV